MSYRLWSWMRCHLCSTLLLGVCGGGIVGSAQAACYSTPSAAIRSVQPGPFLSPVSGTGGYRVTGVQSDRLLRQRWATVASCDRPDWPVFALQIEGDGATAAPIQREDVRPVHSNVIPVVRAGDVVRLWKQEDRLRIEVAAVSEESGALGKTIRLRLLRRNDNDPSVQGEFNGIVRGAAEVEMQP